MAGYSVSYIYRFVVQGQQAVRQAARSQRDVANSSVQAARGLRSAERSTRAAGNAADRAASQYQKLVHRMRATRTISRGLGGMGGAGLVGGFGTAMGMGSVIREIHSQQKAMNMIRANMQGFSKEQYESVRQNIMGVAKDTPFMFGQTAGAALELARMGYTPEQLNQLLRPGVSLGGAAAIDPGKAVDILTNAMAALEIPLSKTSQTADLLTQAFTNSNQDLLQLREALKFAQPTMAGTGHQLNETLGLFMLLSKRGLKGGIAGTTYARMMEAFDKSSGTSAKAFAKLGLNRDEFFTADGKNIGLAAIIKKLNDAKDRVGLKAFKESAYTIFGARANRGVKLLLDNLDVYQKQLKILEKSHGATWRSMEEQMRGLPGAWNKLKAAYSRAVGKLDESGFTKDLIAITNKVRELVNAFASLDPATIRMIGRAGLLVSALSAVLLPLGIFALAVRSLIPVAIAAGGALGFLARAAALPFFAGLGAAAGYITRLVAAFVGFGPAATGFLAVMARVVAGMTGIGVAIAAWREIKAFLSGFFSGLSTGWEGSDLQQMLTWITEKANAAREALQSFTGIELSLPSLETFKKWGKSVSDYVLNPLKKIREAFDLLANSTVGRALGLAPAVTPSAADAATAANAAKTAGKVKMPRVSPEYYQGDMGDKQGKRYGPTSSKGAVGPSAPAVDIRAHHKVDTQINGIPQTIALTLDATGFAQKILSVTKNQSVKSHSSQGQNMPSLGGSAQDSFT